jgi:hypothetical protein
MAVLPRDFSSDDVLFQLGLEQVGRGQIGEGDDGHTPVGDEVAVVAYLAPGFVEVRDGDHAVLARD